MLDAAHFKGLRLYLQRKMHSHWEGIVMLKRFIIDKVSEDTEKATVYDIRTNKFYKISSSLARLFHELQENPDMFINNPSLKKQIEMFIDKIDKNNPPIVQVEYSNLNRLSQVRIIVANTCNMACKYCYASGGNYGKADSIMNSETYEKVCDYLINYFDFIEEVNFFGGEPFLNISAIEYICKRLKSAYEIGEISRLPSYSVVTNGTIIDENIIRLINKYKINVIISLDSTVRKINDKNRIFVDGRGSYTVIDKNIRLLKQHTGQPMALECTYSKLHYDNNISYVDIMEMNYNEYGIKNNIIVPLIDYNTVNDKKIKEISLNNIAINSLYGNTFEALLGKFLENGLLDHSLMEFLSELSLKEYNAFFCNAAIGQIAIDVDGDIYPCQMFIDNNLVKKDYCMGNVKRIDINKYNSVIEIFNGFNKNREMCQKCDIMHNCSDCFAQRLILDGELSKIYNFCNRKNNVYKYKMKVLISLLEIEGTLNSLAERIEEVSSIYKT